MSKEQIIQKINSKLPELKDRYHIKKIGIFGSVAREEDKEKSDIDILVELYSPIGLFDFVRLENILTNILGKKVDLVSNKALKPQIKDDVLKEVEYV